MRSDHTYLEYIRESIERVQLYASEGEHFFRTDPKTQDAILRRMETLADAAAHLSSDLKARHADIRWRHISDFRNVLAHGYTQIRLDQVWQPLSTIFLPSGPWSTKSSRTGEGGEIHWHQRWHESG